MPNRPPRLDIYHQQYAQPLFFITFNTHRRAKLLATTALHERFVAFAREAERRDIAVGRYVIMPDHLHLFVRGGQELVLEKWVGMLRRCLSQAIVAPRPHWQEGFFDHLLRHDESSGEKWEYIRHNPVRAGLCDGPDDWPYQGEIVLIDRV
jgi:REP element-mobilizing transposase RayT